jgi:hypothetical protein
MQNERGPTPVATGQPGMYRCYPKYRTKPIQRQGRFPLCRLHRLTVVDDLPRGCPLRAVNAVMAAHEYCERGWRRQGEASNLPGARDDLHRADVCGECIPRLIGHPHIRRLRAEIEWCGDA